MMGAVTSAVLFCSKQLRRSTPIQLRNNLAINLSSNFVAVYQDGPQVEILGGLTYRLVLGGDCRKLAELATQRLDRKPTRSLLPPSPIP